MRMEPEQRLAVIVTAAVSIARESGLAAVTHAAVAKRCHIPTSAHTVRYYLGSRGSLWRAVIYADDTFVQQGKELGVC